MDDDPDEIPGMGEFSKLEIASGFALLDPNNQGFIDRRRLVETVMKSLPNSNSERVELALAEILSDMNQQSSDTIDKESWISIMQRWLQSNSERRHNIVVVSPSTPSQYFHCLRRQIHRCVHWRLSFYQYYNIIFSAP